MAVGGPLKRPACYSEPCGDAVGCVCSVRFQTLLDHLNRPCVHPGVRITRCRNYIPVTAVTIRTNQQRCPTSRLVEHTLLCLHSAALGLLRLASYSSSLHRGAASYWWCLPSFGRNPPVCPCVCAVCYLSHSLCLSALSSHFTSYSN